MEFNIIESITIEPSTTGESSGNGSLPPTVSASSSTASRRVRPARPSSVFARYGYPRQCAACLDTFPTRLTAHGPCGHNYCRTCMRKLFEVAIADQTRFPPRCCQQRINLRDARKVLTKTLADRFAAAQREYETPRTYCHLCNTSIPPQIRNGDNEAAAAAAAAETRAVCPSCQAATCTTCKAEFHPGACREEEHVKQLHRLAEQMQWKACPRCNMLIERNGGCSHRSLHPDLEERPDHVQPVIQLSNLGSTNAKRHSRTEEKLGGFRFDYDSQTSNNLSYANPLQSIAAMGAEQVGLKVAFYLYPCLLLLSLLGAQTLQFYRDRRRARDPRSTPDATDAEQKSRAEAVRRSHSRAIWLLQVVLSLLLLGSIIAAVRQAIADRNHDDVDGAVEFPLSAYLASYVGVVLYYFAGLLPDPEGPWTPGAAHCCAWIVGALVEVVIAAVFLSEQASLRVPAEFIEILNILALVRVFILLVMAAILLVREYRLKPARRSSDSEEQQSLLGNGNGSSGSYGSVPAREESVRRTQVSGTGWLDYFAGFKALFPYLWPKYSVANQSIVVFCLILLICQRTVNVLAPRQLGILVDTLGRGHIPYKEIILYVVYRALQGNQGALGAARSVLWIPVSQSLFSQLSTAAFEHTMGLSLEFHLNKKIGEVTSALSRGAAINSFLESFCFQVFPMVFDIFVAGVVFFVEYDAFYTIIVFFIMWSYIFLTIYVAKYRARQRRDMATKAREMDAVKMDAILAYETVQHNCAVTRETERYREHVTYYQKAERLVQWSLNGLNLTQSSIFTLGTALLVAVSAYKISIGTQTVGEFVGLINYFVQLQGPLNFFGTYFNMLQNNLIEAERLLELFQEKPGVEEKSDAVALRSPRGGVSFKNVNFAYPAKKAQTVLEDISFTVAPGTKTAIVGESGSGKSTCLRLLFRFYDVSSGSITIDDHDIRDLKSDSLRQNIGVVPQDTVLFNATIMYNLLYAKPGATEEDVYEACKAANIHDRILNFPDGYQTKVGERGLKLSGGERQRVAIARAILKDAPILLLDEATASLDSQTERQIQDALERVTAGRTTITIAHRLSTITTSDQIVVLHKGKIVERGSHHELLALQGRYHAMWEKQTTIEKKEQEKLDVEATSTDSSSQQ